MVIDRCTVLRVIKRNEGAHQGNVEILAKRENEASKGSFGLMHRDEIVNPNKDSVAFFY